MTLRTRRASRLGLTALACGVLVIGGVGPASARPSATGSSSSSDPGAACLDPAAWGLGSGAARGGRGGLDHSDISAEQQRAIEQRTAKLLAAKTEGARSQGKGKPGGGGGGGGTGGGTTSSVTIR